MRGQRRPRPATVQDQLNFYRFRADDLAQNVFPRMEQKMHELKLQAAPHLQQELDGCRAEMESMRQALDIATRNFDRVSELNAGLMNTALEMEHEIQTLDADIARMKLNGRDKAELMDQNKSAEHKIAELKLELEQMSQQVADNVRDLALATSKLKEGESKRELVAGRYHDLLHGRETDEMLLARERATPYLAGL